MTLKDERIGLRVPKEMKASLLRIAKAEGRSLGQICELLLGGGIHAYQKNGPKYVRDLLQKHGEKET